MVAVEGHHVRPAPADDLGQRLNRHVGAKEAHVVAGVAQQVRRHRQAHYVQLALHPGEDDLVAGALVGPPERLSL